MEVEEESMEVQEEAVNLSWAETLQSKPSCVKRSPPLLFYSTRLRGDGEKMEENLDGVAPCSSLAVEAIIRVGAVTSFIPPCFNHNIINLMKETLNCSSGRCNLGLVLWSLRRSSTG